MRSLRAKTAREQRSFFRVSRMSFESTLGSGEASTLWVRNVILPARWPFIAATPSINSPKMSLFTIAIVFPPLSPPPDASLGRPGREEGA